MYDKPLQKTYFRNLVQIMKLTKSLLFCCIFFICIPVPTPSCPAKYEKHAVAQVMDLKYEETYPLGTVVL